jgi:dihydroflavonol-4-reductase
MCGAAIPGVMRVAVTGASGFLGSYVVEALAQAGDEVVGVVRDAKWADAVQGWGASEVRCADLLDRPALTAAFAGAEVAVLVAALAVRHDPPWEEWVRANVDGVAHALEAAAAAGVRRVVLVSTVAVHRVSNPLRTVPLSAPRLDAVRVPWSLHFVGTRRKYSLSKAQGERLAWERCAALGLELVVLRPGPVYGGRDPKSTARYRGWLDRRVVVLPTAGVPQVHAGDVAACCVAAAHRDVAGRAYFVTGEPVSLVAIARTLRALAGRGPWVVPLPVPLGLRYDDGPAAADLSFAPRSLRDGLAEVLAERPRGIPRPTREAP